MLFIGPCSPWTVWLLTGVLVSCAGLSLASVTFISQQENEELPYEAPADTLAHLKSVTPNPHNSFFIPPELKTTRQARGRHVRHCASHCGTFLVVLPAQRPVLHTPRHSTPFPKVLVGQR